MKINLVPEVKQAQIKIHKINTITTTVSAIVGIALAAVCLLFLSYVGIKKAQISSINSQTDKINQELVAYKDLEATVISLETGLKEIKQVIGGGPRWDKFFAELEKATPGDVQIENLSISSGELSLGLLGKEVKSVDRFIKSFSNYQIEGKNLFTNVTVDGYSVGEKGVSFQSKLKLVEGILW